MFNEMKFSSLVHKFKNHDATQMPAWKVMRMATIDGAKALCMDDEIGSLRAREEGRPDYHRPFLSASESNLRRADPESDSESGILRTRS